MSFSHQDWTPVVLHKRKPKSKKVTDFQRANGTKTVTTNRAGKNNLSTQSGFTKTQREALDSEGPRPIKRISKSISQNIQTARTAGGMTRKQLAQKLNQPVSVIADYENGKAIPDFRLINKLERVLNCKLR